MKRRVLERMTADAVLAISIFFFPGYVVLLIGFVFMLRFHDYYEGIFAGIVIDALFASSGTGILGVELRYTAAGSVLFLVAYVVRIHKNGI
jgi:hypothetical protein